MRWAQGVLSLSKNDVVNTVLLVNALCWYLYFFSFLKSSSGFIGDALVIIVGFNLLAVILSAFLSTKLIKKSADKLKFIIYWMIVGVILSPTLLLIGNLHFLGVILLAGIIGAYFGLGFPIVLGYYSATTKNVGRGKLSGIIIFFTYMCFILISIFTQNVIISTILLTLWKLGGLIIIAFLKPSDLELSQKEPISYKKIVKTHSLLFYLIPWLMFSIVNNFSFPIVHALFDNNFVSMLILVENILVGIFALLFGVLADRFGRRRLVFFGFVMLGLGYALLGLLPGYNRGLIFYTVADSIAWGIFSPIFLLTIWGDIADKYDGGKFFVIGFLPYMLSNFLQVAFGTYVVDTIADLAIVFSFASFFLFIAAIPMFLASETLSAEDLKKNELDTYIRKAQKKLGKLPDDLQENDG